MRVRRRLIAALAAIAAAAAAAGPAAAQQQPQQQPAPRQRQAPPVRAPAAQPAAGAEADYVTRGTGPTCPRAPCSWDVRNAATRERAVVGSLDIAALRLPQARATEFLLDLVEGRFVVRGAVVGGGAQPALRISRIVRVAPGTIATRSGLTGGP
jgi:hypothetical protein